jgi:hypothetical protein
MALSTELNAPLGPVVIGGLIRSTLCDASVLTACVGGKAEPRAGPKSSRRGKGDMMPDKVRSRLRTIARQRGRAHNTIPDRCCGCPSRKRTLQTTA